MPGPYNAVGNQWGNQGNPTDIHVPNYGIVESLVAAWLGAGPGGRWWRVLNKTV